ncbi:MAG: septum formation initiator family protein [Bacteroidales bacterium]|nr:septum formation initiator family protein [Candidatus Scybalousia scybalohippi]MCQ2326858.1 septum formation initiator family protein [Bacteroidales bacterium]
MSKLKLIWEKIVWFVKEKSYGKYVIVGLIFLVALFFSKNNNLAYYFNVKSQKKELEQYKKNLEQEIKQDSINAVELQKNINAVEKFGREKYMMKRPNEDIYIIKPKSKATKHQNTNDSIK